MAGESLSVIRKFLTQRASTLAGILAVLAIFGVQLAEPVGLERIGSLLFDSYQRAAPRPYKDASVRVIDIDEESIRRLGQWPWPRTQISRLVDQLTQAGAAAIAFDIVFSEPDRTSPKALARNLAKSVNERSVLATLERLPDNDTIFAQSAKQSPVVLGYFLQRQGRHTAVAPKAGIALSGSLPDATVPYFPSATLPLPELWNAAPGAGFVSLAGESDGIIREAPLLAMQNNELLPSLSLEAIRVAQGSGAIMVRTSNASGETAGAGGNVVSVKAGAFEAPVTASGALLIHYTKNHPQRIVPAWKILQDGLSPAEKESAFAGRIVFVGASAAGLRDLISTPLADREPGVLVHAQAAEQMILGEFLTRPDWAVGLERTLVLLLGLILALLLPLLGAARAALLGGIFIAVLLSASWFAFSRKHYLLDPTYPVLAIFACYVVQTLLGYAREERRRAYIHQAFDRYLSPEMVRRIASDPGKLELGGEERDMTVLFCDIRGFSRISEGLTPRETIHFLIAFLTPMCDELLARKATLDKFIGDAILAFWNAPLDDPCQHENAARGALAMVETLKRLNATPPIGHWPGQVKLGIGLNAGLCCVGNMGSAQRLSYSLIGDTVNLASRIEGLTKYYGVAIALGSNLAEKLSHFAMIELDRVRVVGRDTPETLYALLGDETVARDQRFKDLSALINGFHDHYRNKDWVKALAMLDQVSAQASDNDLAAFAMLYRDRIERLKCSPPDADWDGIWQAEIK